MEFTTEYKETLQLFRTCSPAEILRLVATEIPQDRLPLTYLNSLSEEDRTVCLRATIICWVMSQSTMVPREMQLRVVLADAHAKDALIAAAWVSRNRGASPRPGGELNGELSRP
jgi:hypothetical protein